MRTSREVRNFASQKFRLTPEDYCCQCAVTTHASSTLSSNTEMCTRTPGLENLWANGHSLISA